MQRILLALFCAIAISKKHTKQYVSHQASVPQPVSQVHMRAEKTVVQHPGYSHITSFTPNSNVQHYEMGPNIERPTIDTQYTQWAVKQQSRRRK